MATVNSFNNFPENQLNKFLTETVHSPLTLSHNIFYNFLSGIFPCKAASVDEQILNFRYLFLLSVAGVEDKRHSFDCFKPLFGSDIAYSN